MDDALTRIDDGSPPKPFADTQPKAPASNANTPSDDDMDSTGDASSDQGPVCACCGGMIDLEKIMYGEDSEDEDLEMEEDGPVEPTIDPGINFNAPFRLLDLPAEIQLAIWQALRAMGCSAVKDGRPRLHVKHIRRYVDDDPRDMVDFLEDYPTSQMQKAFRQARRERARDCGDYACQMHYIRECSTTLGPLLRVSRKINHDVLPLLYEDVTFEFDHPCIIDKGPVMPEMHWTSIRSIVVNLFPLENFPLGFATLMNKLKGAPRLEHFRVQFDSELIDDDGPLSDDFLDDHDKFYTRLAKLERMWPKLKPKCVIEVMWGSEEEAILTEAEEERQDAMKRSRRTSKRSDKIVHPTTIKSLPSAEK
ncbi:hypothetical protein CAC42_7478 [Sphaceloma murrayae]|uniref:Uncharacterized protein n=1 Tax=Sphaceloma murrayae TaxID=2082308 RepID=A0A2K1QX56_9PEZI|nr:hypothetical protein CAC42_7478 [Sphaceloma murrayae]